MTDTTELSIMPVSETTRQVAVRRLRSIEGQIGGLQRMLEDGRYCIDVLNQLSATQQAMRSVARLVMRNYLENCATSALRSGDPDRTQEVYDEIMEVLFKYGR